MTTEIRKKTPKTLSEKTCDARSDETEFFLQVGRGNNHMRGGVSGLGPMGAESPQHRDKKIERLSAASGRDLARRLRGVLL